MAQKKQGMSFSLPLFCQHPTIDGGPSGSKTGCTTLTLNIVLTDNEGNIIHKPKTKNESQKQIRDTKNKPTH